MSSVMRTEFPSRSRTRIPDKVITTFLDCINQGVRDCAGTPEDEWEYFRRRTIKYHWIVREAIDQHAMNKGISRATRVLDQISADTEVQEKKSQITEEVGRTPSGGYWLRRGKRKQEERNGSRPQPGFDSGKSRSRNENAQTAW